MSKGQSFPRPWHESDASRGILIGLTPDPNSGYRATVWFEYTRWLFNEIREGSLIAIRNFSDRRRLHDGTPDGNREQNYEEYTILQIDQVHPWHYAIQGSGDQGFPGFTTAAAESARRDWTEMDDINRDDVSRIRCEAIPLRLAFRPTSQQDQRPSTQDQLPRCFPDRSMPMPGYEAYVLTPSMTDEILNRGLAPQTSVELGRHIVQHDVSVRIDIPDLLRLHFGIFGYTGAGKSNLVSTVGSKALSRSSNPDGNSVYGIVLFDLVDEYTGLLIDQLVTHRNSRVVVAGRNALPQTVLSSCQAVANRQEGSGELAEAAARDWSQRIVLPRELSDLRAQYIEPLRHLIVSKKVRFYETRQEQGQAFHLDIGGLISNLGPRAYGQGVNFQTESTRLRSTLQPIVERAASADPTDRDSILQEIIELVDQEGRRVQTQGGRSAIDTFRQSVAQQRGARGALGRVATAPQAGADFLNTQPDQSDADFNPALVVVIGESAERIAEFGRMLIDNTFVQRRERSLLYPTVAFVFDEADVFVAQRERGGSETTARMVEQATLLARRGRKFGLGLGIATQRIRYLDTSIMAQPHTYFISRLPRKSDREAIAEAFAISEETLEQTFAFTTGQWLVASHDATGLKGTPFPVQMENANDRVTAWLAEFASRQR